MNDIHHTVSVLNSKLSIILSTMEIDCGNYTRAHFANSRSHVIAGGNPRFLLKPGVLENIKLRVRGKKVLGGAASMDFSGRESSRAWKLAN